MAHEITERDGLVLAGKPAWHGLGTVVEEAPTPQEALRIAGLGWTVSKEPLYLLDPRASGFVDEAMIGVPGAFAMVRSDLEGEDSILGTVGKGYEPFQNQELADLVSALDVKAGGPVVVESAGSLAGGRTVFFLARLGRWAVGIGGADESTSYALFTAAHDGSRALRVFPTDIRVVCANTERWARQDADRNELGFAIRHTVDMRSRVDEVRDALQGLSVQVSTRQAEASALVNRPLGQDELKAFFLDVYQEAYGAIPSTAGLSGEALKTAARKQRRATSIVSAWVQGLESPNQTVGGIQGTAWAALNAVTEWSDHEKTVKAPEGQDRAENRKASNLFGSSAALKTGARERALALV